MAKACAKTYNANIGIGVTGTMGNIDPANPDASVPGRVYFAIVTDGKEESYYVELEPQPTRLAYKQEIEKKVCNALNKIKQKNTKKKTKKFRQSMTHFIMRELCSVFVKMYIRE